MKIKIRIKATVTDLALAEKYKSTLRGGYFTAENGEKLPLEKLSSECDEVIEYTVFGEYHEDGNKITITYNEPEDIGFDCTTALIFDKTDRSVLTMARTGELSSAFRFDLNERRQLCGYETPFMPVEFTVNTKRMANKVSEKGGGILIDYCIEVRGVNTERNVMLIEVRPYDAE